MAVSEALFLVVGGIGGLWLAVSVLLGAVTDLGHHGVGGHAGDAHAGDGGAPTWLSASVVAAALFALGATGYTALRYQAATPLAWAVAVVGGLLVGFCALRFVLRPLARQQHNSLIGRDAYVGCRGRVTLRIPAGGRGQVAFADPQGAMVYERAASTGDELAGGAHVLVVDLTADGVVVERDPLHREVEP